MKINNKLIQELSTLAKLNFDEESSVRMKKDLENIIDFIDKLSEIKTEGVEPLIYLSKELDVLRKDKIAHEISKEDALRNAPQKDSDYFKAPTVLKK